jgi:tRNA(Ile)-lysidine synthase
VTTAAACAALGLPVWEDPHNSDPSFQRVRLRREVLPLLEDVLQGGVAEALSRTADLLRADVAALDEAARKLIAGNSSVPSFALLTPGEQLLAHGEQSKGGGGLSVAALAQLPSALRTRVLRLWAHRAGAAPLSAERTAALDALVTDWHGQGPIELPGGIAVHRRSGTLEAYPIDPKERRVRTGR